MNYLVLINNAPNYRSYYSRLGEELQFRGNEVVYALDSRITDYLYPEVKLKGKKYYFTDYFKDNYEKELFSVLVDIDQSKMLFADMERFYYYKLHEEKPREYWFNLRNNLLNFFYTICIDNKIDAILYENVSNGFAYAGFLITKVLNIAYIGLAYTRLPYEVFEVHQSIDISDQVVSGQNSAGCIHLLEDYINKLKNKQAAPSYMKNNTTAVNVNYFQRYFSINKLIKLKRLILYVMQQQKELFYNFQNANPIKLSFHYMLRNIFRWIRVRKFKSVFCSYDDGEKFLLYPLHFHPEASTSVLSPAYVDELSLIRKISLELPNNVFLYVKEHPNAFGYNLRDFYRQLELLPNVRLIHYAEDIQKLLVKSLAVVTLTSTLGYEALLFNKKVILFGDVFYKKFQGCYFINSDKGLKTAILEICNQQGVQEVGINKGVAELYLKFVYPGKLFDNQPENIGKIVDVIEKVTREH